MTLFDCHVHVLESPETLEKVEKIEEINLIIMSTKREEWFVFPSVAIDFLQGHGQRICKFKETCNWIWNSSLVWLLNI